MNIFRNLCCVEVVVIGEPSDEIMKILNSFYEEHFLALLSPKLFGKENFTIRFVEREPKDGDSLIGAISATACDKSKPLAAADSAEELSRCFCNVPVSVKFSKDTNLSITGIGAPRKHTTEFLNKLAVRPDLPAIPENREALMKYYAKLHYLAQSILDEAKVLGQTNDTKLKWNLTPVYDRIPFNGGFVLRYDYNRPHSFFTPLGKVAITNDLSRANRLLASVLERAFGVNIAFPEITDGHRTHGPVCYISKDLEGNNFSKADLTGLCGLNKGNHSQITEADNEKIIGFWKEINEHISSRPTPQEKISFGHFRHS